MINVATLLSIGRHPRSGWPRCSPTDQRAVELALGQPDAKTVFLHAGDPSHPVLGEYLGLGVAALGVLVLPAGADPVPALAAHLRAETPDLVLTGNRGDGGRETGMVPYILAETLGLAFVSDVVAVTRDDGRIICLQGLPGGHRRRLACPLPAVVAVSANAPKPRAVSRRLTRVGRIVPIEVPDRHVVPDVAVQLEPAATRPRRLRDAGTGDFADRLRNITGAALDGGAATTGLSAEEAAARVMSYLSDNGCPVR